MRKRWTAKTEITESILRFREKRKWQIALRRYVLGKNKSSYYAPFFGLDSSNFRKWIEIQFKPDMNWDNFSINWQLDHILPITYFNFSDEDDLRLCWNFINIRAERVRIIEKDPDHIDILSAKSYFESLYHHSSYPICKALIQKISDIQLIENQNIINQIDFLTEYREKLISISKFQSDDFSQLNEGIPIGEILARKKILEKFGNPSEESTGS